MGAIVVWGPQKGPQTTVVEAPRERLGVVCEVTRPHGRTAMLATNGRLYQRKRGGVQGLVQLSVDEWAKEWEGARTPAAVLESWQPSDVPPEGLLLWLHQELFSKYPDQEVMVLNGRTPDGDWIFGVPKQKGCGGSVEIDGEDHTGMELMEGWDCTICGLTHVHPGDWTGYSGTDAKCYEDWPGLHPIVSRDGKTWSLHASVRGGGLWTVKSEQPLGSEFGDTKTLIWTAGGQPLEDVVKEDRPWNWGPSTQGFGPSGFSPSGMYQGIGFCPQDRREDDYSGWTQDDENTEKWFQAELAKEEQREAAARRRGKGNKPRMGKRRKGYEVGPVVLADEEPCVAWNSIFQEWCVVPAYVADTDPDLSVSDDRTKVLLRLLKD